MIDPLAPTGSTQVLPRPGSLVDLPALPEGLKLGAGCRVGARLYAGLGSMGRRWLMLDAAAEAPQWQDMPPFPGVAREQAVAVAVGTDVLVLGGLAAGVDGAPAHVLDDIHRFDTVRRTWGQVDSRIPRGLLGAAGAQLPDGRLYFFGGVNKGIVDDFLRESARAADAADRQRLLRAYLERAPQDYRFVDVVQCFDPVLGRWSVQPAPGCLPVAGAALACAGPTVTLVGGEIKPGLRTDRVQQARLEATRLAWLPPSALPSLDGRSAQEGLAGAFCGYSHEVLLCAGGTHFPGARERFAAGHAYAHEGLGKAWRREVYACVGGRWREVGRLPAGRAHGLSVELGGRLWLLGGEGDGGQALSDLLPLEWDREALPAGALAVGRA